jgi:hypothetical protein
LRDHPSKHAESKRRQFCSQYLPGIDMKYSLRYYRFVRKIRAEAP